VGPVVEGGGAGVCAAGAAARGGSPLAPSPPLAAVTPLYMAMAHAAGVPLPGIAVREPPPLMLALIAESPDTPIEQRLTAAETAAPAGGLSPEPLAAAYPARLGGPGTTQTGHH